MHSLDLVWHVAMLDPVTGLGVLLLPDQIDDDELADSLGCGVQLEPGSRPFLSDVGAEYTVIMRQLASIGCDLPRDVDGMENWFVAGKTKSCRRSVILLHGLDPNRCPTGTQASVTTAL